MIVFTLDTFIPAAGTSVFQELDTAQSHDVYGTDIIIAIATKVKITSCLANVEKFTFVVINAID